MKPWTNTEEIKQQTADGAVGEFNNNPRVIIWWSFDQLIVLKCKGYGADHQIQINSHREQQSEQQVGDPWYL